MTDAPSEEELVTIEKHVNDLAADMLRSQVVALVAALRSERTQTEQRSRDARDSLSAALVVAADLSAELERERTQTATILELASKADLSCERSVFDWCGACGSCNLARYLTALNDKLGIVSDDDIRAARAALSTQEANNERL